MVERVGKKSLTYAEKSSGLEVGAGCTQGGWNHFEFLENWDEHDGSANEPSRRTTVEDPAKPVRQMRQHFRLRAAYLS